MSNSANHSPPTARVYVIKDDILVGSIRPTATRAGLRQSSPFSRQLIGTVNTSLILKSVTKGMSEKTLKHITVDEINYLALKQPRSAGDSFNDVISRLLKSTIQAPEGSLQWGEELSSMERYKN
jgi:hypothetical protein